MNDRRYQITRWSEEQWLQSELECSDLLARSDADQLFLSWQWQTLWWSTYRDVLRGELCLLAFHREGRLCGLAPFYLSRRSQFGVITTRSLQLVGMCWRNDRTLISEYLDIIAISGEGDSIRRECLRELFRTQRFSELIVASTSGAECWTSSLAMHISASAGLIRNTDPSVSYQADLSDGFNAYAARLKATARRSLLHLRTRLELRGAVELSVVSVGDVAEALSDLNRLHQTRWGGSAFTGTRLEFHREFAERMAKRGHLRMSRLYVAGRLVSVLYDIRLGDRQYNLQMGFDPGFDRGVSLGLLHLGYAMEQAADAGVKVYDFLAGWGKNADYKLRFGQLRRELSSVQYVHGPILSRLYRWYINRTTV